MLLDCVALFRRRYDAKRQSKSAVGSRDAGFDPGTIARTECSQRCSVERLKKSFLIELTFRASLNYSNSRLSVDMAIFNHLALCNKSNNFARFRPFFHFT